MDTFNWSQEDNKCFGCGDNPWGLKLEFEKDGDWMVAKPSLHCHYQGFKNSAHGGIIATLLDEAAAWAVMSKTGRLAPSFKLNCEFKKPVPLEEEITTRAKILTQKHGVAKSRSEILDKSGNTLATARISSKILDRKIKTDS